MQRQGRSLQRSGSKRVLDPTGGGGGDDDDHAAKRPRVPALASVIVEALKVDSLQKLCSSLEPILRRVVSEEVERALAKLGPARIQGRYKITVKLACCGDTFGCVYVNFSFFYSYGLSTTKNLIQ
jgi:hypothetical protein